MKYRNLKLPEGAEFAGSSPVWTEKTAPEAIAQKHMAPKGKCGYLVAIKGALQLVWEDTQEVFDADPEHPILIDPERYHHIDAISPVEFKIEFYSLPHPPEADPDAERPAEKYIAK